MRGRALSGVEVFAFLLALWAVPVGLAGVLEGEVERALTWIGGGVVVLALGTWFGYAWEDWRRRKP